MAVSLQSLDHVVGVPRAGESPQVLTVEELPSRKPLTFFDGDALILPISLWQKLGEGRFTPMDLTGLVVQVALPVLTGASTLVKRSDGAAPGVTIDDAGKGLVHVSITSADTATVLAGGDIDIWLIDATGNQREFLMVHALERKEKYTA